MQPELHLLVQSHVHLFVHLYIDLEVHLQVQLHHQANIKHIYHCFVCTLLCITRCTKNFAVTLIFNWPDFASMCTVKSIFESILKCMLYTLSFSISVIFEGAIYDFLA